MSKKFICFYVFWDGVLAGDIRTEEMLIYSQLQIFMTNSAGCLKHKVLFLLHEFLFIVMLNFSKVPFIII